jgi:Protein of unknown function (DUF3106)
MKKQFQLGQLMLATIGLAVLSGLGAGSLFAQKPQNHPDRPPQQQQAAPRPGTNRPPTRSADRPVERSTARQSDRPPVRDLHRPPMNNFNGRSNEYPGGARLSPRQQVGLGAARPFVDRMRDLTPQQRDRVLQSSRTFQNLSPEQQGRIRQQFNQWDKMTPSQQGDLRAKENTWRKMTPEQRAYVKNDVLPRWRQIPWERQQQIQQKLGVLQNMPEWARNRRLSDPNFTRGMSEEDRQTLHDLSHLHVGGAPDPQGE